MILPAVKIADVVPSMCPLPDSCFPVESDAVPALVASDASNDVITDAEGELDEFLMDAFAADLVTSANC